MADDRNQDPEFKVDEKTREALDRTGSSDKDSSPDVVQAPGDISDEAVKNMPGRPTNLAVDPTFGADKPRAGNTARTQDEREKGQSGGT